MSVPRLAVTLCNAVGKKALAKPASFFLRVPRNSNVLTVIATATAFCATRTLRAGSVSINCNASSMFKSTCEIKTVPALPARLFVRALLLCTCLCNCGRVYGRRKRRPGLVFVVMRRGMGR